MDRVCIDCGSGITRGTRCRSDAATERWRLKTEPRFCKVCADQITSQNRARAVYCSVACKFADPDLRAKIGPKTKRIEKICPHCAATFAVPVSNTLRYNYCSRACSRDARGLDVTCRRCGALFHHGRSHVRSYCSETCRRPASMVTCEQCRTDFRVVPSSVKGRRYCSTRCYMASGLETSIERTVRLQLEAARMRFTTQASIGRWVVDFLVGNALVIEADGSYWHSLRPHVDRRKNAELGARGYVVWRLTEVEIRHHEFPAILQRRLSDHEVTHGELPRLAPGERTGIDNKDWVVLGYAQLALFETDHHDVLVD